MYEVKLPLYIYIVYILCIVYILKSAFKIGNKLLTQWHSQGHNFGGQSASAEGGSHPRRVRGHAPREILKSRVPQMRFSAFCG